MIRYYNGKLFSQGRITDDEVWTDGSVISYVGPAKADTPAFERQIDLRGNLLMPGFKDAHTHSAMTFLRSAADDMPLQDWLFQQVFPREAKLTPESTAAFVKLAFLEYLANGITACFDMYFYTDEITRISDEWGFRTVLCDALTPNNDWDDLYRSYEKYNRPGSMVSYQLGFHAEYTANEDMLKFVSKVVHDLKAPVFSHNSETASEVSDCIARHGCTPTKYFDNLGLFDYGGGGFHCVHMTDEDLDIFTRRGLYAVMNPCSNAKLASGIAPLSRFLQKGVNLALGTDGAASNNALDMFREMYLANVAAKLSDGNAAAGDPLAILQAAVSGGARAMGLTDCDAISVGKQADMIVIDLAAPNMQPIHNIPKNLVYSGNPSNVKMTVIAGRILYKNGNFLIPESVDSIYREAQKYTNQIVYA